MKNKLSVYFLPCVMCAYRYYCRIKCVRHKLLSKLSKTDTRYGNIQIHTGRSLAVISTNGRVKRKIEEIIKYVNYKIGGQQ